MCDRDDRRFFVHRDYIFIHGNRCCTTGWYRERFRNIVRSGSYRHCGTLLSCLLRLYGFNHVRRHPIVF